MPWIHVISADHPFFPLPRFLFSGAPSPSEAERRITLLARCSLRPEVNGSRDSVYLPFLPLYRSPPRHRLPLCLLFFFARLPHHRRMMGKYAPFPRRMNRPHDRLWSAPNLSSGRLDFFEFPPPPRDAVAAVLCNFSDSSLDICGRGRSLKFH